MPRSSSSAAVPPPEAESGPAAPLRLETDANYSVEQFAALTGMTPDEVLQRIYKRRIPAVRGFKKGRWLIPADLVRERLEQRKGPLRHPPAVGAPVEVVPVLPQSPPREPARPAAERPCRR